MTDARLLPAHVLDGADERSEPSSGVLCLRPWNGASAMTWRLLGGSQ